MPNNLASFAIHVDDIARATAFYAAVFGWRFEAWGPPGFFLVHTGDADRPGIQGLMHTRMAPRAEGGPNCFECTIAVDDVDAITALVTQHGGTIVMPKASIPTVGDVMYFLDPEGNRVGAMRYEIQPVM